ncbi:hypothetical protein ACN4EG_24830 [Alkalinema pantanalense CENA528]
MVSAYRNSPCLLGKSMLQPIAMGILESSGIPNGHHPLPLDVLGNNG